MNCWDVIVLHMFVEYLCWYFMYFYVKVVLLFGIGSFFVMYINYEVVVLLILASIDQTLHFLSVQCMLCILFKTTYLLGFIP